MAGIRVVTDSASDLPIALAVSEGIVTVPLDVRLGKLGAAQTAALSPQEFWALCASSPDLPETSAPSPGAFAAAFAAAQDDGCDGAVCVTISSKLSATHQSACAGAAEVAPFPVEVVDSRFATMGEGLLVLAAADHAPRMQSVAALADHLRATIPRLATFGTLDSLDSLRRGGRIGSAAALLGSLLAIKPVIEVRDGIVDAESKQRTRARSLAYLVSKVAAAGPLRRLAVAHAAARDLDDFLALLAEVHPIDEVIVTYIGAVVGAHTGPGTIGVCFERADGSTVPASAIT